MMICPLFLHFSFARGALDVCAWNWLSSEIRPVVPSAPTGFVAGVLSLDQVGSSRSGSKSSKPSRCSLSPGPNSPGALPTLSTTGSERALETTPVPPVLP